MPRHSSSSDARYADRERSNSARTVWYRSLATKGGDGTVQRGERVEKRRIRSRGNMATSQLLDFDRLLAPVSEEAPGGSELRETPDGNTKYFEIKNARDQARQAERRILALGPADGLDDETRRERDEASRTVRKNWPEVQRLAEEILTEKSKDLWVAAWLIEALVRSDGLAGLRDGFRLTRELAERFWDQIHPRPDDDEGYGHTVSQLAGLNGVETDGTLIGPLDNVPITAETRSQRALTLADFRAAMNLDKVTPEARAKRLADGAITLDAFEKAQRETPADVVQGLLDDAQATLDEFNQLSEALLRLCGEQHHPPTSNIRERLREIVDVLHSQSNRFSPVSGEVSHDPSGNGSLAVSGMQGQGGVPVPNANAVYDREEAFRALLRVADYFRRTEPHSPVSYALEQAVRWGRMSLPELMKDLVEDSSVLREVFRRAGIKEEESSE